MKLILVSATVTPRNPMFLTETVSLIAAPCR
jgi:hypothetical protein